MPGKSIDVERGEEMQRPLLSDCPDDVRADFVRKVYSILSLQLLTTILVSGSMIFAPDVNAFVFHHPELNTVACVASLVTLCPLMVWKDRHPTNLALLSLFTLCESYVVGYICTLYASYDRGLLVLYSMGITMALFCGLSAYAHSTKRDFYFLQTFLTVGVLTLLCMSVFAIFFAVPALYAAIATGGIVVFSGFVLYDTSEMLKYMSPDDAIVASVQLYLDIINIFLYVLQLLGLCGNNDARPTLSTL